MQSETVADGEGTGDRIDRPGGRSFDHYWPQTKRHRVEGKVIISNIFSASLALDD